MAEQAKSKGERAELPPEVRAPLAHLGGAEPPAPRWFAEAIAVEPERSFVESLGTELEVLTWGEVGKPGLLLVHGNSAHADWWSFIAPFFAKEYRVTAVSLPGMGASGWRERYSFPDYVEDFEAVAQATQLYASGQKPIYIGHSFGGAQVYYAALKRPDRMQAVIMVDTGFGPPPEEVQARQEVRNIPTEDRALRVYPTLAEALARFRLMPAQPAGQLYVADFIARRSLKRAPLADGSGEGWTWRFDPNMWAKLDRSGARPTPEEMLAVRTPMVHIFGQDSVIIRRRQDGRISMFPPSVREIEIPDAQHHIMIDQPLALVAAIRSLLAVWPSRPA